MKTIVYQSYRTSNVPGWIATCMGTVQSWARSRGYEYRFLDDSFLELPPPWFRERCGGHICTITDLSRLLMARKLLGEGWDRTVWVDADMLVFAPEALNIEQVAGYAFCLELWPQPDGAGGLRCDARANNSITVLTRAGSHVDFFIDAALRIAASRPRLHKLDVGTKFLTGLARSMPLPLLANVGIFSPMLMQAIASGDDLRVAAYGKSLPAPLACANLCGSLVDEPVQGFTSGDEVVASVVRRCMATRGGVVNGHVNAASRSPG